MTDDRPGLDLLADLDAGLLDAATAERVRAAALADPRATAVLAALAATRAELAAAPAPAVPPQVAARWEAVLAAEAGRAGERAPAPTRGVAPSRRRDVRRAGRPAPSGAGRGRPPSRRLRPALVAAVVLAALGAAGVLWARPDPLPSLGRVDLVAAGLAAVGTTDAGGLGDPHRRAGCLRAVAAPDVQPAAPLIGGRRVQFEVREGVLLVLGTGELGTFRIVIVDPACGPGGGELLAVDVVGP
jgi:hypothetical protein